MGERIRQLRKHLKLTQAQFAERLNLSASAILSYEKGVRKITPRTIADICREYNVNEEWLENGVGPMFRPPKTTDNRLAELIGGLIVSDDEFSKQFCLAFLQLDDSEKNVLKKIILNIANKMQENQKK